VLLFLSRKDYPKLGDKISQTLSVTLPYEFMGYSTNFSQPEPNGVRHPSTITSGPVNHLINIFTVKSFCEARLGTNPAGKISVTDWLTFPQQRLLELVSGEVFHDGLDELQRLVVKLKFYPRDVWLYMLAAQWTRISQEEAFVGRAGDVGDELGSQIVVARLVREIMKLAFLMEKQYAPYSKWLGSAFSKLKTGQCLTPLLQSVLLAKTWKAREKKLADAYSLLAGQHNSLKITRPLATSVTNYYDRPYLVIHGDLFANEIRKAIKDPQVKKIKSIVGSIDQFTDSTDLVENLSLCRSLRRVYE
jgi:hypothetical protein